MALRKSDLYASLWKSADELRGSMDASQYKDYVLTLLFVKYVTDKAKSDPKSLIEVPSGGSFDDLVALKGKPEIGEKVNIAIRKLAEANDLQGVINNADFDDPSKLGEGKQMQDRLSNLISIFQDLDFSTSKADGDDLLGDAYEYLMRHFATESGKSKGQFYTPAEVSRVMAKFLEISPDTPRSTTVYDPTCGSGSLLIKVAEEAPNGLTVYGQEMDNATWALSRMNMILHGNETHEIRQGNTLADPKFLEGDSLQTFDYIVANPPFSAKTWRVGFENEFGRFEGFGEPPAKNGDFAFLLHIVKSLKSKGKAAIILPHGVLFRGNSEAKIRKALVQKGLIKAIIGLPPNLFYGTGIPACIIVIDKSDAEKRTGIFMVDASLGFAKDGPKNRLRARDIHRILDVFDDFQEQPHFSRFVSNDEISEPKNDFALSISRYIPSASNGISDDLGGHVEGGIPNSELEKFEKYWSSLPQLKADLFQEIRNGYFSPRVSPENLEVKLADSESLEPLFKMANVALNKWSSLFRSLFEKVDTNTLPRALMSQASESLLSAFKSVPLVDEYAMYERLINYWESVMHDDVLLIKRYGWLLASRPRLAIDNKEKKLSETADFVTGSGKKSIKWKVDLLPTRVVLKFRLQSQLDELESLRNKLSELDVKLTEVVEENSGDEGLFDPEVEHKFNKSSLTVMIKEAKSASADVADIRTLKGLLKNVEEQLLLKRKIKELSEKLNDDLLASYSQLTESECLQLMVDEKWLTDVTSELLDELNSIKRRLVDGLYELCIRYEKRLAEVEAHSSSHRATALHYLAQLGYSMHDSRSLTDPQRFDSPWITKRLGDIAKIRAGRVKAKHPSGKYWLVDMGSVSIEGGLMVSKRTNDASDILREGNLIMPKDDIGGGNIIGRTAYIDSDDKYVLSDHLYVLEPFEIEPLLLHYLINSEEVNVSMRSKAVGSAQLGISRKSVEDQEITFPSSREEQMSLAKMLGDIESTVEAMMEQVRSFSFIRNGIHREVLTGNTRMPKG